MTAWLAKVSLLSIAFLSLAAAAHAEGPRPLRLDALVAEALRRQPELSRARNSAKAAAQVPSRVGSLPDPWLQIALQNIRIDQPGLDTSPMAGVQIGIAQMFPFPGKLARREAVAQAGVELADRMVDSAEAGISLRVRRAYWELHFAEAADRITRESERILDTLANVVHERFAVGQAAQQDALQSEVAHSRARAMVEESAEAVVSARRALEAAVGRSPSGVLPPTEAPPPARPLDRLQLLQLARQSNPALGQSHARLEISNRTLAEAERDRWPDFQLGAAYRIREAVPGDMSNGADMIVASFGVSLPIWLGPKQDARGRETWALRDAARDDVAAVDLDVTTSLERMLDAVERLDREVALYDGELLPQANQALDASIADYQFGKVGFVSVLQNWETELGARLTRIRLTTARAERLAEVQALLGRKSLP